MTTTANIASYVVPLGMVAREPHSGRVWSVDELKGKSKVGKAKKLSELGLVAVVKGRQMSESISKPIGDGRFELNGKIGVWRTIRGRKYFFPEDGSVNMPWEKNKESLS